MTVCESGYIFYAVGRTIPQNEWRISKNRVSRIYKIHSGTVYVRCASGKELKLLHGHWYFFPEKLDFCARQDESDRFDHTYFDFTLPYSVDSDDITDLTLIADDITLSVLETLKLFAESVVNNSMTEGQVRTAEALFTALFDLLPLGRSVPSDITKVVNYINANADKEISVSYLADMIHLETNHFIRKFRGETGVTPYRFIKEIRLTRAFYQLQNGISVTEAAYSSGYETVASFSKAFRKYYGVKPSSAGKRKDDSNDRK